MTLGWWIFLVFVSQVAFYIEYRIMRALMIDWVKKIGANMTSVDARLVLHNLAINDLTKIQIREQKEKNESKSSSQSTG